MLNLLGKLTKRTLILLIALVVLNPLVGALEMRGIVYADTTSPIPDLILHPFPGPILNPGPIPGPLPTPQPSQSVMLDATVTDWVYDEGAGSIYAISSSTNKLTILNAQTLTVDNGLLVGSAPADIEQYGHELYIALSGSSGIQIVDIASRSLGILLPTTGQPRSLAVTSDSIFYTTKDTGTGTEKAYRLDRATGLTTVINTGITFGLVLRADEQTHTLYVGETGSAGSKFIAVNYLTNQIISRSTFNKNYGFSLPYPKILFDGSDVFYGAIRMNGSNLAEIYGMYSKGLGNYSPEKIVDMKGRYVATNQAIYDKDHYLQIAAFPYEADKALVGTNGRVFLQKSDDRTIEAYNLAGPMPALTIKPGIGNSIASSHKIDSWTTDETSPFIYLVSSETNELAVLRKDDFTLVAKRYVGSKPVDVSLKGSKLFIAFRGETHIGVLDTNDIQSSIQRMLIPSIPHKVLPTAGAYTFYWDADPFNSFHATDGLTDSSVFSNYSIGLGAAAYDSSENTIYATSNSTLIKLNADTLTINSSENVLDYSCSDSVQIDGDDLYYCSKRMSKNAAGTVLGTYPEKVIHASDDLVFSTNAIYDRDTYVKRINLPFAITDVYVSSDRMIYLSTANGIYKFADIEGISDYVATKMTVRNPVLTDFDSTAGQISGYLMFKGVENLALIEKYEVHFLDAAGNRLAPIFVYLDEIIGGGNWIYNVDQTKVPEHAVYIGVYAIPYGKSISDTIPAKTLLWDAPNYFAQSVTFTDLNSDPAFIEGTVSWLPGEERSNLKYRLYYIDKRGFTFGDAFAEVGGGKASYSFDIPKTALPEGAVGLALIQVSEQWESPVLQNVIFKDFITPTPGLADIRLVKNRIAEDTVTVNNVRPGDAIRVYSYRGQLLGYDEVKSGMTSLTIKIQNFGNPGEKLIVILEAPGKIASAGTVVTIPGITENGGGTGGGSGSGGGGGGSTPGPGFPGPIAPAPGGSGNAGNAANGLEAVVEKDSSGKSVGKVDVTNAYMASQLEGEGFKQTKTVSLISSSNEPNIMFHIPVEGIQNIVKQSSDSRIEISTPAGSWTIDAQALLASIGENKSIKAFDIKIELVADETADSLTKHLIKGSQLLGKPMHFEVTVTDGGKTKVLNDFSHYVKHTIKVKTDNVPLDELAGLVFDPATNAFLPVPVKFDYQNGILTASLYRKGNSVYAVVHNKTVFKDLLASSAYAESIQALANRTVVNGFPDGTFKPNNKVTRAEFAAMLNKALGITAAASSSKTVFKDVPQNSWYANYVKAAVEAGIITGYEDGSFKPNQTISHQEMVAMLVKAMQYAGYKAPEASSGQGSSLPDSSDVPAWAKSYYDDAHKANLIGRANDVFKFKTNTASTRKECALLIYRVLDDVLFQ